MLRGMSDLDGRTGLSGAAPKIAIGAAILALATSLIAVIVVTSRSGTSPASALAAEAGSSREAKAGTPPPLPRAKRVAAADIVRLRREAVTLAHDAGKVIGVKVVDEDVRKALELDPDDVITALAGRTVERELDLHEAMFALRRLKASSVYVELLRGGHPVLLVWKVDGDLQAAATRPSDPARPGGAAGVGVLGVLGGGGGGLGTNPYAPSIRDPFAPSPPPDPLADTIKKLDDLHYEVPRATVERVFSQPSAYARVARTLPSRRTTGIHIYGVRPGTIVAAIGIMNGDTVRAVNGNAITSPDEIGELYAQIKDDKEWRIDLQRRGRPVTLQITIK